MSAPVRRRSEQWGREGCLPRSHGEQRIDHGQVHGVALELLNEARLMEGDACGDGLADDALALGEQLRSEPRGAVSMALGTGAARESSQ